MNETTKLSTEVKAAITKSLASFLISEKNVPQEITIHVSYKETLAKLHVNIEAIQKAFGQK